ncbi:hypothetical protein B566_EDAN016190 [Ephemera danica]|nr:hypothetical protein B566_EDAN016190 [Ephemera danica]
MADENNYPPPLPLQSYGAFFREVPSFSGTAEEVAVRSIEKVVIHIKIQTVDHDDHFQKKSVEDQEEISINSINF